MLRTRSEKSWLSVLWFLFTNACGIGFIACIMAYGLMMAFTERGPVVEVIKGPPRGVIYASYRGTIAFEVTTARHESCPGTVRIEYTRTGPQSNGADTHVVSAFWPVMSTDMRPEQTAHIERVLPDSVYPGRWRYRQMVNSRCPMREQSDLIAEFEIEVLPTAASSTK